MRVNSKTPMEITQDYRKWLVYNESLNDEQNLYDLYTAVKNVNTFGHSKCERANENYLVKNSSLNEQLMLTENQRQSMLDYISSHYFLTTDAEAWYGAKDQRQKDREKREEPEDFSHIIAHDKLPSYLKHLHAKPAPVKEEEPIESKIHPFFINRDFRRHVFGYALIGFVVAQTFVIPGNLMGVKFPDYVTYVLIVLLAIGAHFAVRNFKKHFLIGGIRYKTAAGITIWYYLELFTLLGLEIALIDIIKDKSFFMLLFILVFMSGGLFTGWIISFFTFFLNGGKVATDPEVVRYRS